MGPLMGSGFLVGLETVKERGILPDYEIDWTWKDTYCKPLQGIKMTVDIWTEVDHLHALIGDGCSVICQPASLLASAWGIPVISWGCTSPLLSDKTTYPTFTRTVGPWTSLAPMFDQLCDQFNWTHIGIITDSVDLMRLTALAMKEEMEANGKIVYFYTIETTVDGNQINHAAMEKQRQVVRTLKNQARVIFIMTYGNDFRNILISAYDEDMLTADYAYIAMDVAHMIGTNSHRPELDPIIYEGIIIGTPNKPSGPEWKKFARRVIARFADPAFSAVPHLAVSATPDEVEVHAGKVSKLLLFIQYVISFKL